MSITTFSSFYYGYQITSSNLYLNFNEGGSELTATLTVGDYTLTTLLSEVKSALDTVGANTYTVTADRDSRKITIASSGGTLSLLVTTGSASGTSAWSLLGFTSDKTGATSYESDSASGSSYEPQFKLQSYVSKNIFKEKIRSTINESASGRVEVISFGTRSFYEFSIDYITNIVQPAVGPIISNESGVSAAESFMQNVIEKRQVEFHPDKSDTSTFDTLILETTPESGDGTSYRLKERFGDLPFYYSTGILRWRVVE